MWLLYDENGLVYKADSIKELADWIDKYVSPSEYDVLVIKWVGIDQI